MTPADVAPAAGALARWAKVIDQTACIGCHACTTACKSENQVPLSVTRTYVKYVDVGEFPAARRNFQVTRCNQCADAPCVTACPTGAMFKRADGIVDFDKSICIGCKACIAACPYDAIFINPDDHSAEKCNFCTHRLDMGLEPACVVVCPVEAILVGDLNDPLSRVAQIVAREAVTVRRPEKETHPKLFYKGAHQATLDPLAARRPDGNLFMWSQQSGKKNSQQVTSGHPSEWNNSAAALLSYDVPQHFAPWDWRVSLYTWTKAIAAGAYLVAALLGFAGILSFDGVAWLYAVPVIAGALLAITGAILIFDLEHPKRFYLIFTHGQRKSWLVRGAYIITAYSLILAAHFVAALAHKPGIAQLLAPPGIILATLCSVYTAYLFAQAKARDLWQNPLLPSHLFVQTIIAGAAALSPVALFLEPNALPALLWIVSRATLVHLLMILGETTLTHGTAHARLAMHEMVRGKLRISFALGIALSLVALAALQLGTLAIIPALLGLLFYEHAFVQAGQSVPLA
jgi:Fe-S-cluster-containing dehydrogenase component/formate-dependent nitrite reductase membrane component NrfD